MSPEYAIRVGAKAVIVRDEHVLLIKSDDEFGPHYHYPGGGHDAGESLEQTLLREVREETSAEVEIGQLLAVIEHAPGHDGHPNSDTHLLDLFFACVLVGSSEPQMPDNPDPGQVAVEWIPMERLSELNIAPDISDVWADVMQGEPAGLSRRRLHGS